MITKTFTFRVDSGTKSWLQLEQFHLKYRSVMGFLERDFQTILNGDFQNFVSWRYLLQYYVPNNCLLPVPKMDQKISIQLDTHLKDQLDAQFANNPQVPFFMPSLAKFCQWSVIHHVMELSKLRSPKPKLVGPPFLIDHSSPIIDIVMVFTRHAHETSIFIPMLREQFDHINTAQQINAILHHLDIQVGKLCHGLKDHQYPKDVWHMDFQLKDNQDMLTQSFDLTPYWQRLK